ncbi:MAG: hypothetical protein ACRDJ4_10500 [Actinomycetota bacterium]
MIVAIVMGVVGGLLMKVLFHRDSNILWDVVFGVLGGAAAYGLYTTLSADVTQAVFALGISVVVAGLLYEIWTRFTKAA